MKKDDKIKIFIKWKYLKVFLLFINVASLAQSPVENKPGNNTSGTDRIIAPVINNQDLFGKSKAYIENVGQYSQIGIDFSNMGVIQYGFEDFGMPVLFTSKGFIHLQKKVVARTYKPGNKKDKKQIDDTFNKVSSITMEWIDADRGIKLIPTYEKDAYHSFGFLKKKARGFKKILYRELYPGIDVEYFFNNTNQVGFEYRIFIKPFADISKLKMKFSGDFKNLGIDNLNRLQIISDIDTLLHSAPVYYYEGSPDIKYSMSFQINNNEVSYKLPEAVMRIETMVFDPFVSSTSALSGLNNGIAKDIDFDKEGNIYIAGGGDSYQQKLAKYDKDGMHIWTFDGSIISPAWIFGTQRGGWLVDKQNGNVFLGQGYTDDGYRIIRLNSNGIYDDYITKQNPVFEENWKMIWNCRGFQNILIAGGGGNANNELAILNPLDTIQLSSNITGLTGGHNDISDIMIDPFTNDLYTLFSVPATNPGIKSTLYKHSFPYINNNIAWSVSTGYDAIKEPFGRPYLLGVDNSTNSISVNSKYVFYWDGRHLKAFKKSDGTQAGLSVILQDNMELMQGGIYADECNNVFIGSQGGIIKVFKFNGNNFSDQSAPDISISGTSGFVYDLLYDIEKKMLYACGDNFIASVEMGSYCLPVALNPIAYELSVSVNTNTAAVNLSVTPAPDRNEVIVYALLDNGTIISTNNSGIFSGLVKDKTYTARIYITSFCIQRQYEKDFIIPSTQNTDVREIYVPNAFTPNGDGINEEIKIFLPVSYSLKYFRIYNRFGQLVYFGTNAVMGWDGKVKGKKQLSGTYVWMAEVSGPGGNVSQYRGTVILIR